MHEFGEGRRVTLVLIEDEHDLRALQLVRQVQERRQALADIESDRAGWLLRRWVLGIPRLVRAEDVGEVRRKDFGARRRRCVCRREVDEDNTTECRLVGDEAVLDMRGGRDDLEHVRCAGDGGCGEGEDGVDEREDGATARRCIRVWV